MRGINKNSNLFVFIENRVLYSWIFPFSATHPSNKKVSLDMTLYNRNGRPGDLDFGAARLHLKVRGVRVPDIQDPTLKLQSVNLPEVGRVYSIRAINVYGVFLVGIHNNSFSDEPVFSFNCFNVVY